MRVFLTGGTGLVGQGVVRLLAQKGTALVVLSRNPDRAEKLLGASAQIVPGDPAREGSWMNELEGCDAVIHLAGENIFARRWSARFKRILQDSRIQSTQNLVQAIAAAARRPQVLLSASAVGYYGPRQDDTPLDEQASPGEDFLAQLCVRWEAEAQKAQQHGVRVALMRLGIVLSASGGALKQMLLPFRLFVGGPVGGGQQWMSWIHGQDVARAVQFLLDHSEISGPVNFTAPEPVRNVEFARTLGQVLRRPARVRTPAWALRLALGQVAEVLTTGQRVVPAKLQRHGFEFLFPRLKPALEDLLCPRPQKGR